jgi:ribonucleotide reductase beta subunit family protein with ferritin-like domain
MILAFFAASDGIVNENLVERFSREVKVLEVKYFYSIQSFIENVHSEVYSQLLESYVEDPDEKLKLFNAIETIPCVKKKADWAKRWIGDSSFSQLPESVKSMMKISIDPKVREWADRPQPSFAERLWAYILVEGVFFSSSFAAIYWVKSRGLLPGLTKSNEFIARDEGLHASFGCLLYSKLVNKLPYERVLEILKDAVAVETEFICDSLPCKLLRMDSNKMTQHIQSVADSLLVECGYPKFYNVKTPFTFMIMINLGSKSNFFEKTPSAYRKAGVIKPKKDE